LGNNKQAFEIHDALVFHDSAIHTLHVYSENLRYLIQWTRHALMRLNGIKKLVVEPGKAGGLLCRYMSVSRDVPEVVSIINKHLNITGKRCTASMMNKVDTWFWVKDNGESLEWVCNGDGPFHWC
jgi:hypothetical protein